MIWYAEFNSVFWLTLSGILVGVCGLGLRMCYKSKCYRIELGCIKIYRDTEDEKEIDEMGIQYHGDEEDEIKEDEKM